MYILRWGSRILERSSPAGLIVGGAALALTLPPVRRGLRATAVLATRGVLMVADKINYLGATLQETAEDLVAEAREPMPDPADSIRDRWDSIRDRAKQRHRKVAVAAAGSYLAAKERAGAMRDDFETIVEEARQKGDDLHLQVSDEIADAAEPQIRDGLEGEPVDIGKSPRWTRTKTI